MKTPTLKVAGLVVIFAGLVLKAALKQVYPNALLIDLCRLSFFVGAGMLIIGLIRKSK